jgi:para-aminobenzoate synthetase component 1
LEKNSIQTEIVRRTIKKINKLGASAVPFLFIIDFELEKPIILPLMEVNNNQILYNFNGFSNITYNHVITKNLEFEKFPIHIDQYKVAFDWVVKNIQYGNSYLLNLTFPTPIKTNYTLKEIFYKSVAKYKIWYQDKFTVFSPEIFVRIKNGVITSFPMKGTMDAAIHEAEQQILIHPKELAEHVTIVDLIRNDLSRIAKNVCVRRFRYIDKIKTNNKNLLQVSSEIEGVLNSNYAENIGELIFSLLPAGSISGAPKKKTLQIIQEAENYTRGYYTGVFGIFDGQNLDSAVMIRFIETINGKLFYKSGGGITAMSKMEEEYQELIDKIYVPIN